MQRLLALQVPLQQSAPLAQVWFGSRQHARLPPSAGAAEQLCPAPQQSLLPMQVAPRGGHAHRPFWQLLLQQSAATLQLALAARHMHLPAVQAPLQQSEVRAQPASLAAHIPQTPPLQRVPAQQGTVGPQLVPASTQAAHLFMVHTPSQHAEPLLHGSVAARQPGLHSLSVHASPVTQSELVRHTPPSCGLAVHIPATQPNEQHSLSAAHAVATSLQPAGGAFLPTHANDDSIITVRRIRMVPP
jgi:hypothetical protein